MNLNTYIIDLLIWLLLYYLDSCTSHESKGKLLIFISCLNLILLPSYNRMHIFFGA